MRLFLMRHARPIVATGVCYGSTDLAVADEEQARVLANVVLQLPQLPNAVPIFFSPLIRCASLAQALSKHLAVAGSPPSITLDARLAELDFGRWEMQPWEQIERAEIDAWATDMAAYRPGGGESVLQMALRIKSFWLDLRAMQLDKALVVAHAGSLRLLLACQTESMLADPHAMAIHAAQKPHAIDYGELLIIDVADGFNGACRR